MLRIKRFVRWALTVVCAGIALLSAFATMALSFVVTVGNSPHPSGMGPSVGVIENLLAQGAVWSVGGGLFLTFALLATICAPPDEKLVPAT